MSEEAEAAAPETGPVADRVVFEFSVAREGDYDEWAADELDDDTYRGYLRRTWAGPIASGDTAEEFVSRGCGRPLDVTLRVAAVEGGTRMGETTEIVVRPAD